MHFGPKYHHEALDGSGYPEGLKRNEIPIEDQIIKVADEYDAIVSKRQYTSHVNISETLKLLIKDSEPDPKTVALDNAAEGVKIGRLNRRVVKMLFRVVIDDTLYEISCVTGYLDYLKEQIKRLETITDYASKMEIAKKQAKKDYYKEGMRMLFAEGENFENYKQILEEYRQALVTRTGLVENLYKEIKIIKKLRV